MNSSNFLNFIDKFESYIESISYFNSNDFVSTNFDNKNLKLILIVELDDV